MRAKFPDHDGSRVYLTDLRIPDVRDRLRAIWTKPMSLDPSRRGVRVTREIAARKHTPESVAALRMRSVSGVFAQSVGLLPGKTAFIDLLAGGIDAECSCLRVARGALVSKQHTSSFYRNIDGGIAAQPPILQITTNREGIECRPGHLGEFARKGIRGYVKDEFQARIAIRGARYLFVKISIAKSTNKFPSLELRCKKLAAAKLACGKLFVESKAGRRPVR